MFPRHIGNSRMSGEGRLGVPGQVWEFRFLPSFPSFPRENRSSKNVWELLPPDIRGLLTFKSVTRWWLQNESPGSPRHPSSRHPQLSDLWHSRPPPELMLSVFLWVSSWGNLAWAASGTTATAPAASNPALESAMALLAFCRPRKDGAAELLLPLESYPCRCVLVSRAICPMKSINLWSPEAPNN